MCGFDATAEEEQEILDYAKARRTFEADIPLAELSRDDRELLLANAALLTHADGEQSPQEKALLDKLVQVLGFTAAEAEKSSGVRRRRRAAAQPPLAPSGGVMPRLPALLVRSTASLASSSASKVRPCSR